MAQAVSWETLIPFKLSLNFLDREPRNAKKLNSIPLMAVDMIISSTPNCPQRSGEASFERMSVFSSISTILDRAISPHPRPTVAIIWWALENSIEFVEGASHLECCKGWGTTALHVDRFAYRCCIEPKRGRTTAPPTTPPATRRHHSCPIRRCDERRHGVRESRPRCHWCHPRNDCQTCFRSVFGGQL